MKPGFSTKIHQVALPQRPATGLPCSGWLLHEPRAVLAGGCAYCTNPRTPRSTPSSPPVAPDPRALRQGEAGTPVVTAPEHEQTPGSTSATEDSSKPRMAEILQAYSRYGYTLMATRRALEAALAGGQADRAADRPQAAQPPGAVRAARCRAAGGRPHQPRADLHNDHQEVRCGTEHSRQVHPAGQAPAGKGYRVGPNR